LHNFYQFKHFSSLRKLIHGVSYKDETMPYSFSLALHTGEKKEDIIFNRQAFAKQLSFSAPPYFVLANQTHSDNITIIDQTKTQGWQKEEDAIENCDALITNLPHVLLCVLTADCVPILLYDPKTEVVATVHAGWRGSAAKIVQKTVEKMQHSFGTEPKNILASIAPAIGKCCYEVNKEVIEHFKAYPHAYRQTKQEKYMLDLADINQQQLLDTGLTSSHIEMSHVCTACEVENYFSYRKEQGCSGRFVSFIGMQS
jgi:hypothetical protein